MATAGVSWTVWRGDQVADEVRGVIADALNGVAEDGVRVAQQIAPRRTGFYANTIEQIETASKRSLSVRWGNITASYAIWIEIGARGRPGRYIIRQSLQQAITGLPKRLTNKL